jgi:LacI family transcriptional regulator
VRTPTSTRYPVSRVTTLLDVARDAGVSRATASRVLSGSPKVSPAARDRVLASAERLHYQVNAVARSLRTSRTGLVGLLIPGFRNDLYGPLADRLDSRLREHGLSVVIGSSGWSAEGDLQVLKSFMEQRLDAVIVAPRSDRSGALSAYLGSLTCPAVLLDRDFIGLERDAVLGDLKSAVFCAMRTLAELGHRRIAVSAYGPELRPGRQAREAFADAVEKLRVDNDASLLVDVVDLDGESGDDLASRILAASPTAVVVGGPTNLMARCLRSMRAILGADPFPSRLSVIVVGSEALADVHEPPLAVITRPVDETADALAELLHRRLDEPGSPVEKITIPMNLCLGPSVGAPPRSG